MCYDAESLTRQALKYAIHRGDDQEAINRLRKEIEIFEKMGRHYYHVSGFAHPRLLVFTNQKPLTPQLFQWGLIPAWVKDKKTADTLSKQTLNARAETIFEKPSFKASAKNKRCLIYLDAFYEHHHFNGKTYPFRISMKNDEPMSIAGLWEEWTDKETGEVLPTISIVTTVGNPMMAKIHNNTKLEGPRMPVILPKTSQDEWLSSNDETYLKSLLKPFDQELLSYKTVGKLKGKEAIGNVPEVENEVIYAELQFN